MFLPISLKMNIVCALVPTSFSEARDKGSSYANVADMREKKPPNANPVWFEGDDKQGMERELAWEV
jgi:hypothetical protein